MTLCTVQQNVNPKHRSYRMKQKLNKYIYIVDWILKIYKE